jgi:SAM-dependent methyltransferase
MKKSLLKILVCPICKGPVSLNISIITPDEEIVEGDLFCKACQHKYTIKRGVPWMLTHTETQRDIACGFNFQWWLRKIRFFEDKTLYGRNAAAEVMDFFDRLDIDPNMIKGKRILDAGCGSGRLVHSLSQYGCEVIGIDLTHLDWAYALNRDKCNVHIIRTDIFHLPFLKETFDLIWTEGVLHHTPDPCGAFRCLHEALKPGGSIYVWVYRHSPQERIRRLFHTTILPRPILFILCYFLVIPYATWQGLRILFRFRSTAFAFFDALSPKYQSGHSRDEVKGWLKSYCYSDIEIVEDRGMFWQAVWGIGKKK